MQRAWATLHFGYRASHCRLLIAVVFTLCRAWALGWAGFSSCSSQVPEYRLSSCGTQVSLLHSMWDLPRPGIEPVSIALAHGLLAIGSPWRSPDLDADFWILKLSWAREAGCGPLS